MTAGRFTIWFKFDKNWTALHEEIKRDPYRYILSKRDYEGCYSRIKRMLFTASTISLYVYYNLRYHQELGLVKKLKFNQVFYLQVLPKVAVITFVTYALGWLFLVDFDLKKRHEIAKFELMKFDPEYFTYDDYKYTLTNAQVHPHADSKVARRIPIRGLFNYYQEAGYITRLRSRNTDIINDNPPKYDHTPLGPRNGEDFEKTKNQLSSILKRA